MAYAIKPCTFEIIYYNNEPPAGYVGPYDGPRPGPDVISDYVALCDPPYIRPKTEAERKADAAVVKREEIYREQEIRTRTVMGSTEIPRDIFDFIEEFYTEILLPAARNNITEADTPKTWGLKKLRDNRNTLLAGLQTWVDDPTKTADDILSFDVIGWSGWDVARPE